MEGKMIGTGRMAIQKLMRETWERRRLDCPPPGTKIGQMALLTDGGDTEGGSGGRKKQTGGEKV